MVNGFRVPVLCSYIKDRLEMKSTILYGPDFPSQHVDVYSSNNFTY
jgi:hypothetical protein